MTLGPPPPISLDKVEWRVDGNPSQGRSGPRCRYVPFIDARDVADLLDQWAGPGNWTDAAPHGGYTEGTLTGGPVLWCTIAVKVDDEWVAKTDVGVPSNFEAQKGLVSDAFKRAGCAKWGCGRNVYDLPTLWAPCSVKGGKAYPVDSTLGSIRSQLQDRGFDVETGRVATPEGEPATDEDLDSYEPPPSPEALDQWRGLGKQLQSVLGDKGAAGFVAWREEEGIPKIPRTVNEWTALVDEARQRYRLAHGPLHKWERTDLESALLAIAELRADDDRSRWHAFHAFAFNEFADPERPATWTASQVPKFLNWFAFGTAEPPAAEGGDARRPAAA